MIKRILFFLLVAILALVAILLFNTFQFKSKQLSVEVQSAPEIPSLALQHFQEAVKYKTISYDDPSRLDAAAFLDFHKFLETTYPLIHSTLSREQVAAGYSLLYKWQGTSTTLAPIILMAHQDVVPIEEETKSMWSVDPFAGEVKDNFIWGVYKDTQLSFVSITLQPPVDTIPGKWGRQ